MSHEQPQVTIVRSGAPTDQKVDVSNMSKAEIRILMQDIFVRSFIFKIALGLAILGAAAIGIVGISSTWITFNAENAVKQAEADLETKRNELLQAQTDLKDVKQRLEGIVQEAKNDAQTAMGQVTEAANNASKNIPGLVDQSLSKQRNDLETAFRSQFNLAATQAIVEFNKLAQDLKKEHLETLKASLDQSVPGNAGNGWGFWMGSWWGWLRVVVYIVGALVIAGFVYLIWGRLSR